MEAAEWPPRAEPDFGIERQDFLAVAASRFTQSGRQETLIAELAAAVEDNLISGRFTLGRDRDLLPGLAAGFLDELFSKDTVIRATLIRVRAAPVRKRSLRRRAPAS